MTFPSQFTLPVCHPTSGKALAQLVTLYNYGKTPFRYRLTQSVGTTESVLDPYTEISFCTQSRDQWVLGVSINPTGGTSPVGGGSVPSAAQLRAQGVSSGTFYVAWYIDDSGISSSQGTRPQLPLLAPTTH